MEVYLFIVLVKRFMIVHLEEVPQAIDLISTMDCMIKQKNLLPISFPNGNDFTIIHLLRKITILFEYTPIIIK